MFQRTQPPRDKTPPAAGRFGLDLDVAVAASPYRPENCPSREQFEARFRVAEQPA